MDEYPVRASDVAAGEFIIWSLTGSVPVVPVTPWGSRRKDAQP